MEKNFREKKSSSGTKAEKSYKPRRSDNQERNFKPRSRNFESKPFRSQSDERPHRTHRPDFEDRPYRARRDSNQERSFKSRNNNSEERPFKPRNNGSEERPYKPFKSHRSDSQEKPRRSSIVKPYSRSYENDRPYERKPFRRPAKDDFSKKKSDNTQEITNREDGIRLNKFIANSGVCSRREADQYIQTGLVSVNGKIVTELGSRVKPTDDVRFDGTRLHGEKKVYVLMNKPKDYVTTLSDPHAEHTVMDLIDKHDCPERIYPVGRLDKSTTGILLLTNDGDLTTKLTHPSFGAKKVYQVTLTEELSKEDLDKILEGVELEDGEIHADAISYASNDKSIVGIEIHSGRNRIVRRIFESLGYNVKKLDRVMFAGLTKKSLRRGEWRFLTEQEVNILKMGGY